MSIPSSHLSLCDSNTEIYSRQESKGRSGIPDFAQVDGTHQVTVGRGKASTFAASFSDLCPDVIS